MHLKKKEMILRKENKTIQTLTSCEALDFGRCLTCILPDVIKGPQPSCCANA
jgi:hypothetical protein